MPEADTEEYSSRQVGSSGCLIRNIQGPVSVSSLQSTVDKAHAMATVILRMRELSIPT
jgi:hypothetical protein